MSPEVKWLECSRNKQERLSSHVYLISKYNSDNLVFIETRVNSNRTYKIFEKTKLVNFFEIPAEVFSREIWGMFDNKKKKRKRKCLILIFKAIF